MKYGVYRLGKARGTTHKYEHIYARADTYLYTYTRHARKEHTIVADKGKRRGQRDEMRYGWVNNVITVQALPQDRHIS